jgi:hypothetical protein
MHGWPAETCGCSKCKAKNFQAFGDGKFLYGCTAKDCGEAGKYFCQHLSMDQLYAWTGNGAKVVDAEEAERMVCEAWKAGNGKIPAIKEYRRITGVGLKVAKDYCDDLERHYPEKVRC